MRKEFTIIGTGVAVVGVVLILITLSTPIYPLNPLVQGIAETCTYNRNYLELYLGIILLAIGAILALVSMRIKSKPSTESIHEETEAKPNTQSCSVIPKSQM
ncbi:MAG TPA: hypothetical protein VNE86_02205 [Nitrososphaerales archaeon]|nr:hypothetical protein [Nitrososphaerales archaeon]